MNRSDVSFYSQGTRCAAWLYRPDGTGPHPCIILAHGFGATRDMLLDVYAERFVKIGLAALVFDYRHFGDRIALWGSSLSGGHVITTAAREQCIAAVVAQIPFTDGLTTILPQGMTRSLRLTVAGLRDVFQQLLRKPPYYITAVAEPEGPLAPLATSGALKGYKAILPPNYDKPNHVAARVLLHIVTYRPITLASRVSCPLLMCICDRDLVTSPQAALKAAQAAPNCEIRHYDGDHFDIYSGALFESAVKDQCDFLVKHLSLTPVNPPNP
ncbi:MAG: acetylxylan esterase [Chloroflexi bacterium]|nr:MAG: acetylxylan esterase [Chloroflexota bacterium]